jgi:hypothetical protein
LVLYNYAGRVYWWSSRSHEPLGETVPSPGNFDPAKAVRQQQAEEQHAQAQRDLYRANILKLLRYADDQLEEIRNPVVSEFVVTERWWTQESKQISDKRPPEAFKKTVKVPQEILGTPEKVGGFFTSRYIYTVATSREHERQTLYYGSWLWLDAEFEASTYHSPGSNAKRGLVKLRQPRAGYAYVSCSDWDPRNVSNVIIELTDRRGQTKNNEFLPFQMYASLEEVVFRFLNYNLEHHTKMVRKALHFGATGQPPATKSQ